MSIELLDPRIWPLTKSDLQFRYPNGPTAGDNPALRGHPDKDLLNRHEWYEVLYYINKFEIDLGLINQPRVPGSVAMKVERMLHTVVPPNLRSKDHITDWLKRNWSMYPKA